jgi:uncharacterized protein YceH (UPF0502 family)
MAVLCLLMLRGPQTTGELRGRSERMYAFDDLAAVELTLDRMIAREPPLVARLPRQPGTKESRYAHLLAGEARHLERVEQPSSPPLQGDLEERVARLEAEVSELKRRLESLGG